MTEENKNKNNKEEEKKDTGQESGDEREQQSRLLDEPIKIIDYVYLTLLSLEAKAWAYLDLVAHPETQKHKKDLNEARFAIDAMNALFQTVEKQLNLEQKKDIQTRLANLRLNFAKE
ncbi:MAG: DUF1844 domain-containing protein [bacterium]